MMTPIAMIQEWRKGCSCSSPEHPEECRECTRALLDDLEPALREQQAAMQDALEAAQKLFQLALPKFNWGASALDATAIQLLNEVPNRVHQVLEQYADRVEDLLSTPEGELDLSMNRIFLEQACEEVDASVFSGDVLWDDRDLGALKGYIARWSRAIQQHEVSNAHPD